MLQGVLLDRYDILKMEWEGVSIIIRNKEKVIFKIFVYI